MQHTTNRGRFRRTTTAPRKPGFYRLAWFDDDGSQCGEAWFKIEGDGEHVRHYLSRTNPLHGAEWRLVEKDEARGATWEWYE